MGSIKKKDSKYMNLKYVYNRPCSYIITMTQTYVLTYSEASSVKLNIGFSNPRPTQVELHSAAIKCASDILLDYLSMHLIIDRTLKQWGRKILFVCTSDIESHF